MHPAPSIIAFTTFSGLGLGLLAWLGVDPTPPTGWVAFVFFFIGFAMAIGGLAASAFHLGRPERALKAFSQWRSSWLSREAWLAATALGLMGIYAAGLIFASWRLALLGWLGAALCLTTVYATSMIYGQLKTVPRWDSPWTSLLFLMLSVAGGALLSGRIHVAMVLIVLAGAVQVWWWYSGDRRFNTSDSTLATATGLGAIGAVRAFEPPHTGPNYLLREMVHVVGRRHAARLRVIALALMVVLPVGLLLLPGPHHLWALLAVVSHILGVLTARWLFFAEAEHVVGLYYGKH
ncbi:DmsC/YnfH family molybdoenzyme membrane anchor subunit [Puniceibacterium sp. IMCC21224]|uniref:dimethyl sulfoxide reductase anchor subunit family protein n=1 Tax=Puniceibacterium sp. IMCC21224 TaxID=1618204 RepID=UPI00064DC1ED|nr:DmsC/YnfH family molybdoenzyme membrane anchor subunit [Puniceibacterium sp. IMCC21224]KMK65664.1 DMSO reductase anchor subunit [Puniceibacterium sp. IMCC21224]